MKLLIRDAHAYVKKNPSYMEMPSGGLSIVADDGQNLYTIRLLEGGVIQIYGGEFCKLAMAGGRVWRCAR